MIKKTILNNFERHLLMATGGNETFMTEMMFDEIVKFNES